MRKITLLMAIVLLSGWSFIYAQKSKVVENNYSRSSLTVLLMNYNDNYASDLKNAWSKLKISDKFDINDVKVIDVSAPFAKREGDCAGSGAIYSLAMKKDTGKNKQLAEEFMKNGLTSKIIGHWYSRTPDGKFDFSLPEKRSAYNATDADYQKAKDSKRGLSAMKDNGRALMNNSYIMVLDFGNILTMDEYYNKMDAKKAALAKLASKSGTGVSSSVKRTKNGYISDLVAYLYKVEFSPENENLLYEMLTEVQEFPWIGQDKGNKFETLKFPAQFVEKIYSPRVNGNQYNADQALAIGKVQKTREELFAMMVQEAFDNAEFMFSRKVEAFRVKAPVNEGNKGMFFPTCNAKIGKKEGISLDQRYFVWEKQEGKDGKMVSKRKGVVRASNKIVDNRQVTEGNTGVTKFYQVSGGKIEPGMMLQQRNDFGIGIALGGGISMDTAISSGFVGRLEYNMSPAIGKVAKFFTETYLYFEFRTTGSTSKDTTAANKIEGGAFIGGGIAKDIHLMRNIKLTPFFGYMYGKQTDNLSVGQLSFGARLPINITYWARLEPGFTVFTAAPEYKPDPLATTVVKRYATLGSTYFDIALKLAF